MQGPLHTWPGRVGRLGRGAHHLRLPSSWSSATIPPMIRPRQRQDKRAAKVLSSGARGPRGEAEARQRPQEDGPATIEGEEGARGQAGSPRRVGQRRRQGEAVAAYRSRGRVLLQARTAALSLSAQ